MKSFTCFKCKNTKELPVTDAQIRSWHSGALLQVAFANIKPEDRDLIKFGICGTCWNEVFPPTKENE